MKKRIEKLEARQQSSKYAPVVIVDSTEEIDSRADIGPATIIIYDDIMNALQAQSEAAAAKPGEYSTGKQSG